MTLQSGGERQRRYVPVRLACRVSEPVEALCQNHVYELRKRVVSS
jgi:hypothetical protein